MVYRWEQLNEDGSWGEAAIDTVALASMLYIEARRDAQRQTQTAQSPFANTGLDEREAAAATLLIGLASVAAPAAAGGSALVLEAGLATELEVAFTSLGLNLETIATAAGVSILSAGSADQDQGGNEPAGSGD